MLLATRHLITRPAQEPPDTAGPPPPPDESDGAGEDCGAGLEWGALADGSAGSDCETGRAVAELERGDAVDERPCATSATNTANPAVSTALEPITQRRM